ncbi:hypothetical protein Ssi02_08660 [Sinosporangium siamense]|uniref:Uncharacterized protein n=1 Tax=Sinosporangium siamense TaxID=1367973 RepID=A0A919RD97_9ACTN|nr:hypothetical protein Ssi02_08660 [Sinosporangium siamense]
MRERWLPGGRTELPAAVPVQVIPIDYGVFMSMVDLADEPDEDITEERTAARTC